MTGHVTKYVTKREPVRRAELRTGEMGWHGVRQRGTWWTFSLAIAGRLAQRYRKCIPVSPFVLD